MLCLHPYLHESISRYSTYTTHKMGVVYICIYTFLSLGLLGHSTATLSPAPAAQAAILIPLVPVVDFAAHALAVELVLVACLDEELWTVAGAAEMALEILPATVGFEGAVGLGAAVGTQSLYLLLACLFFGVWMGYVAVLESGNRRMSSAYLMCSFVLTQVT